MQFESSAQLRAHYAAVRERIHGPQVPPRFIKVKVETAIERPPPEELPEPPPTVVDGQTWDAPFVTYGPNLNFVQAAWIPILKACCEYFHFTKNDMLSPRRHAPLCHARQVAMYLIWARTEMSYPDIGKKLGGRDHTTILHGVRKIRESLVESESVRKQVDELQAILGPSDGH